MYIPIVHSDHSKTLADYSLGQLFKLSIEAGHMCLSKWAETSVALAALELMGGLAQLQIEDASEYALSLFISLSLSLSLSLSSPSPTYSDNNNVYIPYIQWFINTQEITVCLWTCIIRIPQTLPTRHNVIKMAN